MISSICAGVVSMLPSVAQAQKSDISGIKALTFDVYGSTTDYRGTIVREGKLINLQKKIDIDWGKFADDWHDLYQPNFDAVLHGQHPWTSCTSIRRAALDQLVKRRGLTDFSDSDLNVLNGVWERVEPWPDSVPALLRLKRKFILTALSNADMSTMVHLARNRGLPWDVILAAELAQTLKPNAAVYQMATRYLGLRPEEILMVACHKFDLRGAKQQGFRTAFISRPFELGSEARADTHFDSGFDLNFTSFSELADHISA